MLPRMPKPKPYPQHQLAERLVQAMDEANVSLAELGRQCGVTIQAVHDWRLTGRIGKHHLITISVVTKKPLEYFLAGLARAAALLLVLGSTLLLPAPAEATPNFFDRYDAMSIMSNYLRRLRNWLLRNRPFHPCPV